YQGDELGIGHVEIPPDRMRDPQELRQPGLGLGRDRSRTPFPWDGSPHAGFSTVEPWLPLNPDWPTRNAAAQDGDPSSMLSLYRRLLGLRRAHAALAIGDFALAEADDGVLAYERRHSGERLLVALNLGSAPRRLLLPADAGRAELLASTGAERPLDGTLAPDEGLVLRLEEVR